MASNICSDIVTEQTSSWPSPAQDYFEGQFSLDQRFVVNKAATYLLRLRGTNLESHGFYNNDLLIVDTSLHPAVATLVVAVIEGERRIGVFRMAGERPVLETDSGMTALDGSCAYWGTVTASIRELT